MIRGGRPRGRSGAKLVVEASPDTGKAYFLEHDRGRHPIIDGGKP